MKSITTFAEEIPLDVSGLTLGIFIVSIRSGGGMSNLKLVRN